MMPSYNHGKYVRQAVESIVAETYRPLELVVVDDGSSDNSPEILKELHENAPIPFQLELSTENRGSPICLNRCLELANGEFVALCAFVDVPYYIYRTHETNMHKDAAKMRAHILNALESEFNEEERPQALARALVRQVRVCLENNDVKEAVNTLHHLLNDLDDPKFEELLEPGLMAFIKDYVGAERDLGSGQWNSIHTPIHERALKQKEKIAEQRTQIENYRARLQAHKTEISKLKGSASWKIGRMWTKPFRLLSPSDNGSERNS